MNAKQNLSRRSFSQRLLGSLAFLPAAYARSEDGEGYEPLFDGETLDGWHKNPGKIGHGTGGRWRVVEGAIVGEQDPPGSGNGGLLLSDRKFQDFDLLVDMKPDWGPCSGVFFRCTDGGEGFQVYVDYHDNGNVGHLRGEMKGAFALMPFRFMGKLDEAGRLKGLDMKVDPRSKDWPTGVYESVCSMDEWRQAWRIGEWNTLRLRCEGKYPRVQTWINGAPICDFNGETCTLPSYDREEVLGRLGMKGSIGLQVHGGKGWPKGAVCRWKNIRIKTL